MRRTSDDKNSFCGSLVVCLDKFLPYIIFQILLDVNNSILPSITDRKVHWNLKTLCLSFHIICIRNLF